MKVQQNFIETLNAHLSLPSDFSLSAADIPAQTT